MNETEFKSILKRGEDYQVEIFSLLQRINLVEHVGSGIERIRIAVSRADLPKPRFEFGKFFAIIFERPDWGKEDLKTVEKTVEKVILAIKEKPNINIKELEKITGLTRRGVEWNIHKLKEEGKIKRIGPDKGGHWEIVKDE